jgi:hypothetical protein
MAMDLTIGEWTAIAIHGKKISKALPKTPKSPHIVKI